MLNVNSFMFLAGWLGGKYVIHLENELMKRVKKVFCVVMGCIRISFESTKNAVPQTPVKISLADMAQIETM